MNVSPLFEQLQGQTHTLVDSLAVTFLVVVIPSSHGDTLADLQGSTVRAINDILASTPRQRSVIIHGRGRHGSAI
jgi:hypothetical protein